MRCIGARDRDRHEALDYPFDVGLPPTVATLPARHDVVDLSVQESFPIVIRRPSPGCRVQVDRAVPAPREGTGARCRVGY